MKPNLKSLRAACFVVVCAAAALGSLVASGPAYADACYDKCQKDWPSTYIHAIPRKACEAKCTAISLAGAAKEKVAAAWDRTKEVASAAVTTAVNTGKAVAAKVVETGKKVAAKVVETGKKVVDKVAKALLPRGLYDAVKNCIADGLGGCLQKIVTAAGNLARGLYDKVKACVADGLGGCLKQIAKAAVEMACKGVGIFWDAAKKCCAAKGAVQCAKDAAVAVVKKGAQYLCDTFAKSLVPQLSEGAAWLINKAGAALASYKLQLKGSQLGSLACAFKSALGHTIQGISQKFGDPLLTISGIKIVGIPGGNTVKASLGATATISVAGKEGALTLRLEGDIDAVVDTSCNFQGPLATFGANITKVSIGSIPQWLTNAAVAGFVSPRLGCFSFCPKPIVAAGMAVKLDYCRVIDTCLKSKCTAPVLNTVLDQVLPLSIGIEGLLPKNVPDAVRAQLKGWSASLGNAKIIPGSSDPYKPGFSGTLSIGVAGKSKFNIQGSGTLAVKTYCGDKGSMIKVTPSLSAKLGDVPQWMQEKTLPNAANGLITQFINDHGGKAGRYTVAYPAILSGKKSEAHDEATLSPAKSGPSVLEKLKSGWEGLKMAVQTAIAGRFHGDASACDAVAAPADKGGAGGGACHLCMDPKDFEQKPAAADDEDAIGHLTGSQVNFRSGPGTTHPSLAVLKRCAEFKILDKNVKGNENFWSRVEYKGKVGYIATQYVQRGKAMCDGAQPK